MPALEPQRSAGVGDERPEPLDLRLSLLATVGWLSALLASAGSWPAVVLTVVGLMLLAELARRHGGRRTLAAAVLVLAGVAAAVWLRSATIETSPVRALADDGAVVQTTVRVTSDPVRHEGRFAPFVMARARTVEVTGRGASHRVRMPVLLIADESWRGVRLGETVEATARLSPADQADTAAVVHPVGEPRVVGAQSAWWRVTETLRAGIRDAVAHRPPDQRALVPALVDGDDTGLSLEIEEQFQLTGLTHLTAVSGTNLTLIVGFLVLVARWCGVRGRWLRVVAAGGIVGFILLARTEPSVVRAAAMGTVALLGMGTNGRQRGVRALGAAVLCLLLLDPWLARSPGFALSVLATAGILLLGPPWRDALASWLPRRTHGWLPEAIAIPLAAQVACTPVVAALSGQVSLAAVIANVLVAPAVGPTTVLGVIGGLLAIVWTPFGQLVGTGAAWCAWWILRVAAWGATLPAPGISWGTGPLALAVLTGLCVGIVWAAPRLLRRRGTGLACCTVVLCAGFVRVPDPTWPPSDWLVAACDVGQGDALAVRTAEHSAIVIDAGPDAEAVDRCLRRLEVDQVPVLALTHFHDDHVAGLPGVLADRQTGQLLVTDVLEPAAGYRMVAAQAEGVKVPVRVPEIGSSFSVGDVRVQVLGPQGEATDDAGSDDGEGSAANDASLVLLVETHGVRILTTGDVEPTGQQRLAEAWPGLRADVLKVPHHGSRYQDLDFLLGLRARIALVSVGADNDYGHPATDTLAPFDATGALVARTDRLGDVVVAGRGDDLRVVS